VIGFIAWLFCWIFDFFRFFDIFDFFFFVVFEMFWDVNGFTI